MKNKYNLFYFFGKYIMLASIKKGKRGNISTIGRLNLF